MIQEERVNERIFLLAGMAILFCFTTGTLMAMDIVVPGKAAPAQVVAVRKFAMVTSVAMLGDLNAKLNAGAIKAMAANARGLATTGAFLPLVFEQPSTEAYPVAGSKFMFKPGSMDDFLAKAQAFATAAEELFKLADKEDKDGVTAQLPKLQGTCGSCHAVFRGAS
jgi:hypothetical protein